MGAADGVGRVTAGGVGVDYFRIVHSVCLNLRGVGDLGWYLWLLWLVTLVGFFGIVPVAGGFGGGGVAGSGSSGAGIAGSSGSLGGGVGTTGSLGSLGSAIGFAGPGVFQAIGGDISSMGVADRFVGSSGSIGSLDYIGGPGGGVNVVTRIISVLFSIVDISALTVFPGIGPPLHTLVPVAVSIVQGTATTISIRHSTAMGRTPAAQADWGVLARGPG